MSDSVGTGGGRRKDVLLTDVDAIPTALRDYDHWVVARLSPVTSERDKRALAPRSGHTDPENLLTFQKALSQARELADSSAVRTADGERTILAFMLGDTPFVGVDLDDVGTPTDLSSEAERIISKCSTWTEVSQSGDSYHLIGAGKKEIESCRADLQKEGHIEVYEEGQYLCMTGDTFEGASTEIQSVEQSLRWLEDEYFSYDRDSGTSVKDEDDENSESTEQKTSSLVDVANRTVSNSRNRGRSQRTPKEGEYQNLDPSDLTVEIVRVTASTRDPDFRRLWRGSNLGKGNPSDADHALACRLAYWCQGDEELMDRCFRASERYGIRDDYEYADNKWDSRAHDASGETYGEQMIKDALEDNPDRHSGTYLDPSSGSK